MTSCGARPCWKADDLHVFQNEPHFVAAHFENSARTFAMARSVAKARFKEARIRYAQFTIQKNRPNGMNFLYTPVLAAMPLGLEQIEFLTVPIAHKMQWSNFKLTHQWPVNQVVN
jgi:hypothetical protein